MTDSPPSSPPKARGKLSQIEAEIRSARLDEKTSAVARARLLSSRYFTWRDRRVFELTDDEIGRALIENNKPFYESGFVGENDDDVLENFGWPCLHQGWSIVPQLRFGERKPPVLIYVVYKEGLKTREPATFKLQFKPSEWRAERLNLRDFLSICDGRREAPRKWWQSHQYLNLAIQCCSASGDVRVLDIDCRTPEIAEAVKQSAFRVLGVTPFVRYGSRPKVILIYRVVDDGSKDWDIPKFSVELLNADGTRDLDEDGKPHNVIEWLGDGSIFTAYGLHHKTMGSFDWSEGGAHPATHGPEHAPVVTKTTLRAFINAVGQEIRPIANGNGGVTSNPHGGKSIVDQFDAVGDTKIRLPKTMQGSFTVDADGFVTEGGEAWVTAFVWAACAANPHMLRDRYDAVLQAVTAEAQRRLGGARRDNAALRGDAAVARTVRSKFKRAASKWIESVEHYARSGRYLDKMVPWSITEDGRRHRAQRVTPSKRPADGSLDWIPDESCVIEELSARRPTAKVNVLHLDADQLERNACDRQIIEDLEERASIAGGVSEQVKNGIRGWLGRIGDDAEAPLDVLMAPTGAGKTVSVVTEIGRWCRENPRRKDEGPILFVVPSHANAGELMATADREGFYSPEFSVVDEAELDTAIEVLSGTGVKIVRFKGRDAAGCQRSDERALLAAKGIGSSGLCKADVLPVDAMTAKLAKDRGEKIEKVELKCPFFDTCGYQAQFRELKNADVVVLTHAYLTQKTVPKELKNPRAVVIDESVTFALLQQTRFPVRSLDLPRSEHIRVTPAEQKANPGMKPADIAGMLFEDRLEACQIAMKSLLEGKDVAEVLRGHPRSLELVEAAIKVCERSHELDREVRPDLNVDQIREMASRPIGTDLLDEKKFWRTIKDRLQALAAGTAKGKRDARIQVVEMPGRDGVVEPHVRLSWRREPNWAEAPTLLLDASARPRIVEKLFGRKPTVHHISAPLHVRTVALIEKTWSNSSLIPQWDATDDEIRQCAENVEQARRLITTTAVVYGYGRILVGTTAAVRQVLTTGGWAPPPNIDFVHFGALRGLDFAKHHVAAISIGRSEMPVHIVDGYVAALTYDDDDPEQPYDILGTGIRTDGKPVMRPAFERTIRMRTGQDVGHLVPSMPPRIVKDENGKDVAVRSWAQEIEASWREEELNQFLGRLRPVYRGVQRDAEGQLIDVETPAWIACGKVLPEDVIVDELVEMPQLTKHWEMAELVRLGGGILSSNLSDRVPGAQEILAGRTLEQLREATFPKSDVYYKRFLGGMAVVKYRLPGDPRGHRNARICSAWVDGDIASAFESMSERFGVLPDEIIDVTASERQPVGRAKPRPADRIDREVIGGRDAQLENEFEWRRYWCSLNPEQRAKTTLSELEMRHRLGLPLMDEEVEPEAA